MNKKIIIANWKMNLITSKEANTLLKNILKDFKNIKNTDVVFLSAFYLLRKFKENC